MTHAELLSLFLYDFGLDNTKTEYEDVSKEPPRIGIAPRISRIRPFKAHFHFSPSLFLTS